MSVRKTVFPFSLALAAACTQAEQGQESKPAELAVVYSDFETDPITGYHEADLELAGCKFTIRSSEFEAVIGRRVSGTRFKPEHLKAQVTGDSGEKMLVDDDGILRSSKGYFEIDRARFERALSPTAKCGID